MNYRDEYSSQGRELQKAEEFPVGFPIAYPQEHEEEAHLRDYLHTLLRRKWTVIAFFLIVVTTVTISTYMETPIFRSSATIKIEKETPNVMKFKDGYEADPYYFDEQYFETQYRILKSRNLSKRVIRAMRLDQNPAFVGNNAHATRNPATPQEDGHAKPVNEDVNQGLVDMFMGGVSVEPIKNSRLVKISFDSPSPELAAQVPNAIAKTYIDYTIESKFDATQQGREWLEKQLLDVKAKVERAEEQLNQYAAEKGILFLSSGNKSRDGEGPQNFVEKKLSDLSGQVLQSSSERITKESLYRESLRGDIESNPVVMGNPLLSDLRKNLASLESEYSQLSKVYKPDYPKMVRLKEQINQAKGKFDAETRIVVSSLKKDYEIALQKENALKSTLEKYKAEALDSNQKMIQYQILQKEAESNRDIYNGLLQRLKETGVVASLSASNVQILDRAEIPRGPFKPNKQKSVMMAILVGLFGGIGLAFFVEYLDSTVKSPDDIEKGISLPSLGIVPEFPKDVATNPLITFEDKKSTLSEAYRSIGTYIQFSSAVRPPKTMLVTSARQGEGKTTTAINTAISLAHSLGRGILVDADMRKPQLHKVFDLDNSKGLSAFLTGNIEFDTGLIQASGTQNLDVITAGITPPNPSELLSSFRMRDLIQGLFPLYSFVIVDSPPVLGLSDSLVLSTLTDGVILVVKAGETPKDSVQQGKKLLRGVNAKILGIVLNGIKDSHLKYSTYSYYYSYYSDEVYSNRENKKNRRKRKTA